MTALQRARGMETNKSPLEGSTRQSRGRGVAQLVDIPRLGLEPIHPLQRGTSFSTFPTRLFNCRHSHFYPLRSLWELEYYQNQGVWALHPPSRCDSPEILALDAQKASPSDSVESTDWTVSPDCCSDSLWTSRSAGLTASDAESFEAGSTDSMFGTTSPVRRVLM